MSPLLLPVTALPRTDDGAPAPLTVDGAVPRLLPAIASLREIGAELRERVAVCSVAELLLIEDPDLIEEPSLLLAGADQLALPERPLLIALERGLEYDELLLERGLEYELLERELENELLLERELPELKLEDDLDEPPENEPPEWLLDECDDEPPLRLPPPPRCAYTGDAQRVKPNTAAIISLLVFITNSFLYFCVVFF